MAQPHMPFLPLHSEVPFFFINAIGHPLRMSVWFTHILANGRY